MGYTYNDIVDALKNLNINEGDSIFVHSNLGFFGKMENCSNADELCENFLNAIVEVIGEEGTLVLPAFSYSFCNICRRLFKLSSTFLNNTPLIGKYNKFISNKKIITATKPEIFLYPFKPVGLNNETIKFNIFDIITSLSLYILPQNPLFYNIII